MLSSFLGPTLSPVPYHWYLRTSSQPILASRVCFQPQIDCWWLIQATALTPSHLDRARFVRPVKTQEEMTTARCSAGGGASTMVGLESSCCNACVNTHSHYQASLGKASQKTITRVLSSLQSPGLVLIRYFENLTTLSYEKEASAAALCLQPKSSAFSSAHLDNTFSAITWTTLKLSL